MTIVKKFQPIADVDYFHKHYQNANEAWEYLYYGLNILGEESAPRGLKVRETLGCDIYIDHPEQNLIYNSLRKTSPYYLAQEYFWYLSGDRDVDSISKYSGFWKKIANEDGTINSNYGAYIFNKDYYPINGMSQWEYLIETLRKDPDSRQAILQIPITPFKGTKDVCCTSSLQFFIRNNKLYMTTYMRSNDINLGFCNDIPFFTGLQIKLGKELGVELGWYRHVVGSLHVYENNFIETLEESSGNKFMFEEIVLEDELDYSTYDFEKDYEILKDRKTEGVSNPILIYMAENKDGKYES